MKRLMTLCLISLLALIVVACGSDESEELELETDVEASEQEEDNIGDETGGFEPVYPEEELESDPRAPSNDPGDYNQDGEFVPSGGPSTNPADYNKSGEYKPADEMTPEEIERELLEMFDEALNN